MKNDMNSYRNEDQNVKVLQHQRGGVGERRRNENEDDDVGCVGCVIVHAGKNLKEHKKNQKGFFANPRSKITQDVHFGRHGIVIGVLFRVILSNYP